MKTTELVELSQEIDKLITKLQVTLQNAKKADVLNKVKKLIKDNKDLKKTVDDLLCVVCSENELVTCALYKDDVTNRVLYSTEWNWYIIHTIKGNRRQIIKKQGNATSFISKLLKKGWKTQEGVK